jgi:hypothetical protein
MCSACGIVNRQIIAGAANTLGTEFTLLHLILFNWRHLPLVSRCHSGLRSARNMQR